MATKLIGATFIISFWLFFPVMVMFMESTDFIAIDSELGEDVTQWNVTAKAITIYFTILVLYIPNAPFWMNTIILIFKLVSLMIAYLLLRGD